MPIGAFGIFAALAIVMNYVLICTWWPCVVIVWEVRRAAACLGSGTAARLALPPPGTTATAPSLHEPPAPPPAQVYFRRASLCQCCCTKCIDVPGQDMKNGNKLWIW